MNTDDLICCLLFLPYCILFLLMQVVEWVCGRKFNQRNG